MKKPMKDPTIEACLKRLGENDEEILRLREKLRETEAKCEQAEDRVFSLEGVVGAVDRMLEKYHGVHASRALAIEQIAQRYEAKVQQLREALVATFDECDQITERFIKLREKALSTTPPPRMVNADRPKIICLCGSTRFTDEMLVKQWELTKQGNIVLSWCAVPESYFKGPHVGDAEGVKEIVDEVHKRKIDLCDSVFVMNVGGYFGESTTSEIKYATAHGKPVEWLEQPDTIRLEALKSK